MIIAYDTESISTYLFILDMLFENESAELHSIASGLLANVFTYVQGAYYLAYDHMLKASHLEPDNYEYLGGLLLFYYVPEKILEKDDALIIAKKILSINPESVVSKEIINE